MSDDKALVYKVTRGKNGDDKFEIELDYRAIDIVFIEYQKLLDEAHAHDEELSDSVI